MTTTLIGRFLMLDSEEAGYFTVSRFAMHLHDTLYLMEPQSPHTAGPIGGGAFIVDLNSLAIGPDDDTSWPRARIFKDAAELMKFLAKIDRFEDDPEPQAAVTTH